MQKFKLIILVVFTVFININAWSKKIAPLIEYKAMDLLGTDKTISRGSDLLIDFNPLSVTDPPNWKKDYCYNSTKGTLVLRFKDQINTCIPNITNYQVTFTLTYLTESNTIVSFDTVLSINYNNSKGKAFKERAIYVKENVHYLKAEVKNISNPEFNNFVCLEAIIEEDRTFCGFNPITDIPTFTSKYLLLTDEIELLFPEEISKKCDFIEVEYQFVDAYNSNGENIFLPKTSIWYDFRHNANRTAITGNSLKISNIFEDGYLILRARGVVFKDGNKAVLGNWSIIKANDNLNNLYNLKPANIIQIGQNGEIPVKEPDLNWQYQAEFAEDAKKKEVMTFFDGLLKNRQTVTRSNTEYIAIVAENIYDHIGRPTISTLPAPSNENKIKYYKNFNANVSGLEYNQYNFEIVGSSACTKSDNDDPMNENTGAAKYYSANNSLLNTSPPNLKNQLASYIPNANRYPFTHTEYMPDQTSRVRRQSGAGNDLKLGAGHETKYFYGVPDQMELDRLFGTEVGNSSHYKKNMVIDPNGQASISYLDAKGRVIATNLAGTKATNLSNLSNNTGVKDIVLAELNSPMDTTMEEGALIINKTFNIAEDGTKYDLKYSLSPQSYIPKCKNSNELVCYNCIYDLEIKLVNNECNEEVLIIKRKIGGNSTNTADIVCDDNKEYSFFNENSSNSEGFLTVTLPIGNFTLSKKLSINNAAFEFYLNDYLNNRLCKTKQDFLIESYQHFDTTQCEQTCETCYQQLGTKENYITKRREAQLAFGNIVSNSDELQFGVDYEDQKRYCGKLCEKPKTGCDAILETLKGDYRPGGQYMKYKTINGINVVIQPSGNINLNILSSNSTINYTNHPFFISNGISTNGVLTKRYSTFTVDEIINNWQDTFTNVLVSQHPEYCKYTSCVAANINDDFMDDFLKTESYSEAVAKGYLFPVGNTVPTTPPILVTDPYFQAGKPGSLQVAGSNPPKTFLDVFRERLESFLVVNNGTTNVNIDIHDVAIINMYCNDKTSSSYPLAGADLIDCIENHKSSVNSCVDNQNYYWTIFKNLYYAERQKITDTYVKTICPYTLTNNDDYEQRFPDNDLESKLNGNPNTAGGISSINNQVTDSVNNNCLNTCNGYKNHWRNSLKNCVLDSTQMETILGDLVNVCLVECDIKNPFGASNISSAKQNNPAKRFYSFDDVLKGNSHLTSTTLKPYVKGICDDVLISMPSPLGHDYLSYNDPYADTCACDPQLYNYTGTRINANITPPNPACNNCNSVTNLDLNPEVKLAIANLKNSDKKYKCKNCIDCCAYKKVMYDFIVHYDILLYNNTSVALTTTPSSFSYDKYTILTNYFNQKLGFNLSYDDYISFGANCFDTSTTFDAITQKANFKLLNHDTVGDCGIVINQLPLGDSSYSVKSDKDCYKYYLNGSLVDPDDDYYKDITHPFMFDSVDFSPVGCRIDNFYISNYNRNFGIDTCGCNKIFKAESEFSNGTISTESFSSAKDYIERTFNCGITLNNYYVFKSKCESVKDFFTTPNTLAGNSKTVKYNADGTLNWNDTRQTEFSVNAGYNFTVTHSAEHILHEISSSFNSGDNLYNINSCGPTSCANSKILCNKPFNEVDIVEEDPCKTRMKSLAKMSAENAYKIYVDSVTARFKTDYYKKCLRPLNIEKFVSRYEQPQYQYTLYYYDQAGNLAKTIPPKGVKPLNNNDALAVNTIRKNNAGTILIPAHQMATLYKYNTLQNLTWQKTPDAGISNFYYDNLGRLVVSQNAKQIKVENNQYSYTKFDNLGRIIEVGQIVNGIKMSDAIARNEGENSLSAWLETDNKTQITKTYYDEANTNVVDDILFKQSNLRGRVVYTTYSEFNSPNYYDHAVHYDYDIHGNVKQLMREVTALKTILQDYKITKYDYDLVSGKVNNVYYQQGQADQYMHHYEYDAENRIIGVQSGQTKNELDEDAAYYYYMHGPLARIELGHLKVQGIDYAYTLQGWLKGVNTTHINSYRDMGRDGYNGTDGYNGNSHIPIDEYGFSLNYYEGDYSPIGLETKINRADNFTARTINATSLNSKAKNLYNGNIRMMAVAIRQFGYTPIANAYQYDQLNRLIESNTFDNYDSVNNAFLSTGNAMNAYKNTFAYDENGNILTQIRNGNTATVNMDNLSYEYYMDGTEPTNKLKRVRDAVSTTNYTDDIDDQDIDNYNYDEIGNLIKDDAEQIETIEWTVYGKIRKITRIGNSTKPDLEFEYTPDGHRAVKIVKPERADETKNIYTYYVRDAQGNIMATYTRKFNKTIDYNNLTYSQINNKIKEKAGEDALANFIKIYSNNPGLKTSLLNSVSTDVDLLKNFNPNLLLNNHGTALNTLLNNISNLDYVKIFVDNNLNFQQLCECLNQRKENNPSEFLNLKQALLTSQSGVQLLIDFISINNPIAFKDISNANNYSGSGETQDRIDFIKTYLFEENVSIEMLEQRRNDFATSLTPYYNFDDNCQLLAQILNEASQTNQNLVNDALANIEGIKAVYFNGLEDFNCTLSVNRRDAIDLLSNRPDIVWNALLQSQNAAYWLAWLKDNDPDFLYLIALKHLDYISTYQTNHNIYGGEFNGKQNYFVNIRTHFGQSTYDKIVSDYINESSVYIDSLNLSEWHIYGSSRIGIYQTSINMAYKNVKITNSFTTAENEAKVAFPSYTVFAVERGAKRYELTNHLGNVLAVVSDKKIQVCTNTIISYYIADLVSATDYSPFGAPLAGRTYTAPNISYRFGFNGQEKDDEVSGAGNSYTAEFWQYDSRLGRRFNIDPVVKYHESPYACFSNNPIFLIDPNGADTITTPNNEKVNMPAGYAQSNDKQLLYGESLITKIWDKTAGANKKGEYVDYDQKKHGALPSVTSLSETFGASFDKASGVIVAGAMLNAMKNETGILAFQNKILIDVLSNENYRKESFSFELQTKDPIFFGGAPSSSPMWFQAGVFATSPVLSGIIFPETWDMALDPLTWTIGRNYVVARVEVSASGTVNITYKAEGNMNLDTGKDKSVLYKAIAKPLDKTWQALGGSGSLPTYAAWHVELFKKK